MTLDEWIGIGMNNGVVDMPEVEEKTFEEVYKLWFKMKMSSGHRAVTGLR